jgi:hypothetical protein
MGIDLPDYDEYHYYFEEWPKILPQMQSWLLSPIDEIALVEDKEDRARRTYAMNGYGLNGSTGELRYGIRVEMSVYTPVRSNNHP